MRVRISIHEPDFTSYLVACNGIVQEHVQRADMEEREVWRYAQPRSTDKNGQPVLELATGLVTILPKKGLQHG